MELKDITKDAVLISQDASFRDAIEKMVKEKTNSLLVVGEDGVLVGEVGVSDLLDAIVPQDLDGDHINGAFETEESFAAAVEHAGDKPVSDFMAVDVEPVRATDGLMAVTASAIAQRRASIPVVDHDDRPIGVISRRGLKHILAASLGIKDIS